MAGEEFRFEHLEGRRDLTPRSPVWAVSRGREFVGTMSYADAETVKSSTCGASDGWLPCSGDMAPS